VSSRFTRLESDILDALAWDLERIAPDLAGQFAEALPGTRRNTGSGLYTELIVDRDRPPPLTSPTGRFGTVHAMVGDLDDPVAFQIELRQGRLLALHGDAYGQDTRDIDFARVPYDQIFALNDQGDSIAFDPAALMQPSPLLDLHRHTDLESPLINRGALQRVQEPGPPDPLDVLFGTLEPGARGAGGGSPPEKGQQTSVLIGAWVAIAAGALIATLIFRLPIFFTVFLAVMVGRLVHRPEVLAALSRAAAQLRRYEYRPPQQ